MSLQKAHSYLNAAGIVGAWATPNQTDQLDGQKGAYVLLLQLARSARLEFGPFSGSVLRPGCYAYMGSARGPGGLRARLTRHFRADKKLHWHIDRLTAATGRMAGLAVPGGNECALLAALLERPEFEIAAPRFGSTDCKQCPSHLLRITSLSDKRKRPPKGGR